MSWKNLLENQEYKYKCKHKYRAKTEQSNETKNCNKLLSSQIPNIGKCFKFVTNAIDGGDNKIQMVQMSKTLSTKSIRDELCTNAGTGRGRGEVLYGEE